MTKIDEERLVDRLLWILSPMGSILPKSQYGATTLYKDNIMFAIVDEDSVYLKTEADEGATFIQLEDELPYKYAFSIEGISLRPTGDEMDDLLKLATKSYWLSRKDKLRIVEAQKEKEGEIA